VSKIPHKTQEKTLSDEPKLNPEKKLASHPNLWRCFAFRAVGELGCVLKDPLSDLSRKKESLTGF